MLLPCRRPPPARNFSGLTQVATADSATQGAGPRWNMFQYSRYAQWRVRQAAAAVAAGAQAPAQPPRAKAEEEDEADSRDLRPRGRAPALGPEG